LPHDTTARQAYDLLSQGFGPGFNGPLLVAASLPDGGAQAKPALTRLALALSHVRGVVAVSPPARLPGWASAARRPASSISPAGSALGCRS
jgi:uncharacterized membrane protein YdfJ with MMPL/SSD domain